MAEYGDGWIGFNLLPDEAAPKIKRIHELMKQQGRNLTEVELGVSPNVKRITPDDLKRYRWVSRRSSWSSSTYHAPSAIW